MARTTFRYSLLVCIFAATYAASAPEGTASPAATSFIKSSCSTTTYPTLCVESLAAYAGSIQQSHRQLAQIALSVSVDRAKDARTFVSLCHKLRGLRHRDLEAVKDCFEEVSDAVDRLGRAVQELKQVGGSKGEEFVWHMSNVQTWVSAALTDDSTCMDEFSEKGMSGKLKESIRGKVLNVGQVTSNALALVNQYASKQQRPSTHG